MSRSIALVALALALAAGSAHAEPDRTSPPPAKISLTEAVRIAEQHSQGKAIRAEYERKKDGKWVYDITVANGAALTEVTIDTTDGVIVSARDARDDEKDDD